MYLKKIILEAWLLIYFSLYLIAFLLFWHKWHGKKIIIIDNITYINVHFRYSYSSWIVLVRFSCGMFSHTDSVKELLSFRLFQALPKWFGVDGKQKWGSFYGEWGQAPFLHSQRATIKRKRVPFLSPFRSLNPALRNNSPLPSALHLAAPLLACVR